jgi:hypothetical protein
MRPLSNPTVWRRDIYAFIIHNMGVRPSRTTTRCRTSGRGRAQASHRSSERLRPDARLLEHRSRRTWGPAATGRRGSRSTEASVLLEWASGERRGFPFVCPHPPPFPRPCELQDGSSAILEVFHPAVRLPGGRSRGPRQSLTARNDPAG